MLLYFTTDLNEDPGTVRDLARVDPAHLQNSFKKIGLRTGPAILFFTFFMFIFGVRAQLRAARGEDYPRVRRGVTLPTQTS